MDFQSMMNQAAMGDGGPGAGSGGDAPQHDNAETIYISSLALLKVRHSSTLAPTADIFCLDAQTWTGRCSYGSHGSHAWRVC